jgi:FkbM family methyltransferase
VRAEILGVDDRRAVLGEVLSLTWESPDPETRVRAQLRHAAIRYLKPITDWTSERTIRFFPEAPGPYAVLLQWRNAAGDLGARQLEFLLEARGVRDACDRSPTRADAREPSWIWTPSVWDARIAENSERATLAALAKIVRPGDVVYDIGANLGLYAIRFATWVGPAGRVYCFEPNPVCVSFLQATLAGHGIANTEILPVALLDEAGSIDFAINYGNSFVSLTSRSWYFAGKVGHQIAVQCASLDELILDQQLEPPSLIKLDIEGAEAAALRGMARTLASGPVLALELHGAANATASFEQLDPLGYRYCDLVGNRQFDCGAEVVAAFGNRVFQVLATRP